MPLAGNDEALGGVDGAGAHLDGERAVGFGGGAELAVGGTHQCGNFALVSLHPPVDGHFLVILGEGIVERDGFALTLEAESGEGIVAADEEGVLLGDGVAAVGVLGGVGHGIEAGVLRRERRGGTVDDGVVAVVIDIPILGDGRTGGGVAQVGLGVNEHDGGIYLKVHVGAVGGYGHLMLGCGGAGGVGGRENDIVSAGAGIGGRGVGTGHRRLVGTGEGPLVNGVGVLRLVDKRESLSCGQFLGRNGKVGFGLFCSIDEGLACHDERVAGGIVGCEHNVETAGFRENERRLESGEVSDSGVGGIPLPAGTAQESHFGHHFGALPVTADQE